MKKFLLIALFFGLFLGMAFSGGKKEASAIENPVTISVALMCSDFPETAQEICDTFTLKYPNIKVQFTAMAVQVEEYLQPKIAANSVPDFMSMNGGQFGAELADNGILADLKDTEVAKNEIDNFKTVFTSPKGKLFGIAGGLSTTLIYYNKKMFSEAGITSIPDNWDEFLDTCDILKRKGFTPLVFGCADGDVTNTVFGNAFAQNIVTKDPNYNKKIANGTFNFNTTEFADCFNKAKILYDKGYLIKGAVSLFYPQATEAFMQGKAAMSFEGIWMAGPFFSTDFGTGIFMAPFNAKGQTKAPVLATETGFAVKEGPNKEAALKFLSYINMEEGFYMYQNKRGNIPHMKNVDPKKVKIAPEVASFVDKLVTYKVTGPLWFEFLPPSLGPKIPPTYQRVLLGEITPQEAASFFNNTYKDLFKNK